MADKFVPQEIICSAVSLILARLTNFDRKQQEQMFFQICRPMERDITESCGLTG
jgi:hypothetical protein